MNKSKYELLFSFILAIVVFTACKIKEKENISNLDNSREWKVDFLDDFDSFNSENWKTSVFGLITKIGRAHV